MVTARSVTVNLKADISNFSRGMAEAAAEAKAFSGSLNDSLGKNVGGMNNLVAAALTLGPALVPVAAAATVGIAALGTQLTMATAGAGVAALAFVGVGSALKALDTYSGAPTQANLTALHAKLDELSVAGQSFVLFLNNLKPKFDALKASAQGGFLPGLQEGITTAMHQFPVVNQLVSQLSGTLGSLAKEGGQALNSPFWHNFLTDFARNASNSLETIAKATGNVITGFAGMFQAFMPAGASLSQELLKLSEDFSRWGQGLSNNTGFQQFIQYVEATAPQVVSTLASISKAIFAIVKAAAPVGSQLLPVIGALADGLAAIANSPFGPAIFTAAAAITVLGKALAALKAVGIVGAVSGALKGVGVAAGAEGAAASSTAAALGADALATVGAWGPAVAGLAAVTLGANDAKTAADNLGVAMGNVSNVFGSSTVNLQAQGTALQSLSAQLDAYNAGLIKTKASVTSSWNPFTIVRSAASVDYTALFHANDAQAAQDKLHQSIVGNAQLISNLTSFQEKLAGNGSGFQGYTVSLASLQKTADSTIPVLEQLGYPLSKIKALMATPSGRNELAQQLDAYNKSTGSTAGRTQAVAAAIAELDSKVVSTTTAAQDLQTALDTLLKPGMDLSAATDAWITSLRQLDSALAKGSKTLNGNSNAAIQNRAAVRDRVSALEATLTADAQAGASSAQLTEKLKSERGALINAGDAAGISRSQMKSYLNTLGLTPAIVKTIIQQTGGDAAKVKATLLKDAYNNLPLAVRTDIAANGIPTTSAAITALQKKYNLTPKQILTILAARDGASVIIDGVRAKLDGLNGKTATTYVDTVYRQIGHATTSGSGTYGGVFGAAGANGMVLDMYANGGIRTIGPEEHVAQIAPAGSWRVWAEDETGGEAYIPLAPSKRDRSRSIADETVNRLGGVVQWLANGGIAQRSMSSTPAAMPWSADSIAAALDGAQLVLDDRNGALVGRIQTGARQVVDGSGVYSQRMRRMRG